jgi:hypothetical protein
MIGPDRVGMQCKGYLPLSGRDRSHFIQIAFSGLGIWVMMGMKAITTHDICSSFGCYALVCDLLQCEIILCFGS